MTRGGTGNRAAPSQGVVAATIHWNERVRLVFADVDETIAALYEPATPQMLDALSGYLRDGGRLCLVTGGSLGRVTSGVTDGIDPALRSAILVAPVSGAEVWGFTPSGALRGAPFISRYEEAFTPALKTRWRELVAQLLEEFGLRAHAVCPLAQFRRDVGVDPQDVMVDDRESQISFEFVNSHDLSAEQVAALPFAVPPRLGRADLRVPVLERATCLLDDAGIPVTPVLAGVFALNLTVRGVSKTSAVQAVLGSAAILSSIGLTAADVSEPDALEVWGDDFSASHGGTDLLMSRALPPAVRSIDFRDDDPDQIASDYNIVLWAGEQRLQDGLLEYLTSRPRER